MAEPACPICGRPSDRRARPFCSARCADADLGNWLTGQYRVPVRPEEAEAGELGAGFGPGDAADEAGAAGGPWPVSGRLGGPRES